MLKIGSTDQLEKPIEVVSWSNRLIVLSGAVSQVKLSTKMQKYQQKQNHITGRANDIQQKPTVEIEVFR